MKKSLFLFAFLFAIMKSYANPGDTTVRNQATPFQLSWYGDYDDTVAFPDGTTSYRKVYMDFVLGKYQCPATDQYCGDWDYDIEIYACTPTDTFELGRLITPYANASYPRTPWTWQHPYTFDVTDYASILKDNVVIRAKYNGYSGGFTGTINFRMIEGTPVRNVLRLKPVFNKSASYGLPEDAANNTHPIDSAFTAVYDTVPTGTQATIIKSFITGHGGDTVENCSEFCSKWFQYIVNGTSLSQTAIWRSTCSSNFLYPQSGTWVYNRANWCPGDLVQLLTQDITNNVTAGSPYSTAIHFQPYSAVSSNQALYKVGATVFYYSGYNHTLDAGIDDIISPSNNEAYYRNNPICGNAQITVTNYGSDNISQIAFSYGLEGGTQSTYTYTTSLAPLASATVTLPNLQGFDNITDSIAAFTVKITSVNGSQDEDTFNNKMTSYFTPAPTWNVGRLAINLKNATVQGYYPNTTWTITSMDGTVVGTRNVSSNSNVYSDTLKLASGCYKLTVTTPFAAAGQPYGLRLAKWFSGATSGYIRIYDVATGTKLSLPKTDLGSTSLEGDFGSGFEQYFVINQNGTSVNEVTKNLNLEVYPNPANNVLNVSVYTNESGAADLQLVNLVGQVVYSRHSADKKITIPTASMVSGVYTLIYQLADKKIVEKVVINH